MRSRNRKRSTKGGIGLGDEGIIHPPALSHRTGLPQRFLGNGVPRQAQPTGSREVGIGCAGAVLRREDARAAPPALAEVSAGQQRRTQLRWSFQPSESEGQIVTP
ncbi:hypothetical protein AB1E18_013677 [Capra hircus]